MGLMLVALGAGCLVVRLGLALYGAGIIRSKNSAGAVMRGVSDLCVASLAFWLIGGAILTQEHNRVFWLARDAIAWHSADFAVLFFLLTTVLVGSGVVGGAVAERARFFPLWGASVLLAGLLIPLGANWVWHGWLARIGVIDIGGGSWLHVTSAACALAAAISVGPRTGKYNRDGSASMIPGHNLPLAGAGVLAVLAGWVPYLVGCLILNGAWEDVGVAAGDTVLSAAAAGVAAMLLGYFRYRKPDVILTLMGFLGGLVAICATAGAVGPARAVLIGAVAGLIVPLAAIWIDLSARIDDPAGVIVIHGIGGAWGTVAGGLLIHNSIGDRLRLGGVQLTAVVVLGALSFGLSLGLFLLLKATTSIRASEADEYDGLDLAEHDIGAYPDFQQTMIKSYHLREA